MNFILLAMREVEVKFYNAMKKSNIKFFLEYLKILLLVALLKGYELDLKFDFVSNTEGVA